MMKLPAARISSTVLVVSAAALLCGPQAVSAKELSGSRPNIIVVLADDCGWGEMGITGNPIIKTPTLDRLYMEGTRFTNFHVSLNCAPTRCQLMTGNHNYRHGVTSTTVPYDHMSLKAITVAECLKKADYQTAQIGKWHLRCYGPYAPYNRGFDFSVMLDQRKRLRAMDGAILRNGVSEPYKGYQTDVFFDEAMKWLRQAKDKGPFFMYLATFNPHSLYDVPEKWIEPYKNKGLRDCGFRRPGQPEWMRLSGDRFYAEVANLDWNTGRLLKFMKDEGLEENTIFMYMTDNGHAMAGAGNAGHGPDGMPAKDALYNMGMRGGKAQPWRGGSCVPFIVRWPGRIEANLAIDTLAGGIDFFPTLLDLAGGTFEHKIDGISLVPLLEDPNAKMPDRAIFCHKGIAGITNTQQHENFRYVNAAVQTQHYRWVNNEELFDHRTDPGETNNIAARNPELFAEMKRKYDAWFDEMIPTIYNEETLKMLSDPSRIKAGKLSSVIKKSRETKKKK